MGPESYPSLMALFDLLLDYVVRADHHLQARDYGLLLSSLAVDRQSRRILAPKILEAREAWRREKGFQRYLSREPSSVLQRLSFAPGRGVTKAHRMEAVTRAAMSACRDATEYVRRFSSNPQRITAFVSGDYFLIVRWMTTWATLQRAIKDHAGEHYVSYLRTELRIVQGDLGTPCFNVCRRPDLVPGPVELASRFAEDLISRARWSEALAASQGPALEAPGQVDLE